MDNREGQEKSTPQPKFKVGQIVMLTSIKKPQPFIIQAIERCEGSFFYAWNRKNYAAESMVRELTPEESGVRSVAGGEPEQWISADCKPELNAGRVLTSVHGFGFRVRTIGLWDGEEWKFDRAGMAGTVTHWRPLPAPPQGKEQK